MMVFVHLIILLLFLEGLACIFFHEDDEHAVNYFDLDEGNAGSMSGKFPVKRA